MSEELYGRKSTLDKLQAASRDVTKSRFVRERAGEAMHHINAQLRDSKLNSLRAKLIQATKAGDAVAMKSFSAQIRIHEKKDPETGL
jgi:hypothetical protein